MQHRQDTRPLRMHAGRKLVDTDAPPPSKARMSAKLRTAIKLRVEKGLTIEEACSRAGLSPAGWFKAMQRPDVEAYVEHRKALYINSVQAMRARHKARAYEVAAELMETAQSEAVRMRAVEFFAGEGQRGTSVTVNVGAKGSGYEYIPPGSQVIDITPTTDSESAAQGEEGEE